MESRIASRKKAWTSSSDRSGMFPTYRRRACRVCWGCTIDEEDDDDEDVGRWFGSAPFNPMFAPVGPTARPPALIPTA